MIQSAWCCNAAKAAALSLITAFLIVAAPPAGAQELARHVAGMFEGRGSVEVLAPAGEHPVGIVRRDGEPDAYYASSHELLGTVGYSGKPIDVLVVVGPDGIVLGTHLISQTEPILTLGIPDDALAEYVEGFAGTDVTQSIQVLKSEGSVPGVVSGATISSGVIRDAILRTGRRILELRDALARSPAASAGAQGNDWESLVARGVVRLREVSFGEARQAMPGAAGLPEGEGTFAEIAAAVIPDSETGRALLGDQAYGRLATRFAADDLLLLVAARGVYSVKGTSWLKTGEFDRLELSSGDTVLSVPAEDHERVDGLAVEGAPDFREILLAAVPASAGLSPEDPLSLSLVVDKSRAGAEEPVRFTLALAGGADATEPGAAPAAEVEPLWMENWREARGQLVALAVMLTTLFVALYVSGPIVRHPRVYAWFRTIFLMVTLVWLGWIAGAALSVVQIVAFLQSLLTGFRWDVFLLGPLIFALWAFVAFGVLFWGRGVFCGWLCPFGALQELIHKAGQKLGIKRVEVPWEVHERIWPVKYVALLAIVGISLQDTALAFKLAEIEPFKTAITMHFMRAWPYVAYVVVILAAGLFVERIFCRYLCPLGAALAIPSKFKIFDWLIRRPQCGRECRVCAATCTVQAIDPIGRINPNECIYCLQCQVNYHDPETCVPLKMRRARRRGGPLPTAASPAASRVEDHAGDDRLRDH